MVKFGGNPINSDSDLKILAKTEWNVPIQIDFAWLSLVNLEILCFISFAALFVNVNARILNGLTPFFNK